MAVIIDQVIAETGPVPVAPAPRDLPATGAPQGLTMDQLRFELRRDADRRARLRAD
jgi:hypothetical protein